MTSKTKKKTKAKTAATVASVTAKHASSANKKAPAANGARTQGVGAYRRLVDEPQETAQAEQKRKASGGFGDRAAAFCRYPVVKNLRQASSVAREAAQAVVETARGAAIHLWKRYAPGH